MLTSDFSAGDTITLNLPIQASRHGIFPRSAHDQGHRGDDPKVHDTQDNRSRDAAEQ